jgi:hypothetical protein
MRRLSIRRKQSQESQNNETEISAACVSFGLPPIEQHQRPRGIGGRTRAIE